MDHLHRCCCAARRCYIDGDFLLIGPIHRCQVFHWLRNRRAGRDHTSVAIRALTNRKQGLSCVVLRHLLWHRALTGPLDLIRPVLRKGSSHLALTYLRIWRVVYHRHVIHLHLAGKPAMVRGTKAPAQRCRTTDRS